VPDGGDRAGGFAQLFVAHVQQFPGNHAGNVSWRLRRKQ
jgi:hypothetical protein